MIALTRRIMVSRPWRKFRANTFALVALAGILFYVAIGLACFVGVITAADAGERVGPDQVTGWFEQQPPEKRLRDARFYRERIEAALKRQDPAAALKDIALAERKPAELPIAELKKLTKDASERHDDIADLFDQLGELHVKIDQAAKVVPPSADLAKLKSEIAPLETQTQAKLAELEALTTQLWPMPTGWAGKVYAFRTCMGIDRQGRSISIRAFYSVRIALQVGLVVACLSVAVGTLLGGAAAFFGGWVDHAVNWLYSTFSSIPELVLLSLIAYLFMGVEFKDELIPVYAALSLTFWIGPCRVVRGEVLKIKELEYVQAVQAVGFGRMYILLKHVIPNTMHLMLINFSLLFIAAIKAEVILTFLGLGVKNGASWGIMIGQSRQEVTNGFFWQIGAATALMFILVLAFNIVSDALQDAFDPKHVG